MAEIERQMAELLGKRGAVRIRTTGEVPPRVSVVDVVCAVTGYSSSNAALAFVRMKKEHPSVAEGCSDYRFKDSCGRKGQKDTPITHVRGIVEIIMLLSGHQAALVRRQAAELIVRTGLSAPLQRATRRAW